MSTSETNKRNRRMTPAARVFAFFAVVMPIAPAAIALTPLGAVRYAPDITVVLGGTMVTPQNVAEDNLAGMVSLVNIGSIPNGTDVIAYSPLLNGDQLLAFDTTLTLPGGLIARPGDVVRLSGATYNLAFDAAANGIPNGVMTDAVAQIGPGDLLLSFDVTVALGSIAAAPEDLVRFKNGAFSVFFDGSLAGVPVGLNLDAVDCLRRNGHLLLSFDGSGTVGGVEFEDEDVLEYTPGSNTWALVYDGSLHHAAWPPADLAALSVTPSTTPNAVAPSIGGAATGGTVGASNLPVGTDRIFGVGTPEGKPGDSCIEIYLAGPNGVPDSPPGSVDDVLCGTGGTDAAGNFVDGAEMAGIPLCHPLRFGEVVFASDVCEGLTGATVTVTVQVPALSATGIGLAIGLLLLVALAGKRRPAR